MADGNNTLNEVIIYTDGACSGNPGPGGWSAIMRFDGIEKVVSGNEQATTNNRMELTAAIQALNELSGRCCVSLHSDSSYLINAFANGWLEKWKKNGWKSSAKESVLNRDLWEKLDRLAAVHEVKWIKVKGHSEDEYNNKCDKIAREEIKKMTSVSHDSGEAVIGDESGEPTLKRNRIYNGSVISVDRLEVALPGGRTAARDVVLHPGAAVIIPMDVDGYVYMVRQYRKAVDKYLLEMPAGKLDAGEGPEACARRELLEETGLEAGRFVRITHIYTTPGFCNEVIYVFHASDLVSREGNHSDEDEYIEVEKVHIDDLANMVANGVINDAKTIICILLAEKIYRGKLIV